ncbi:MAG: SagB/ThcOx family dehydrogenase [Actinobacteria bacterium]|nr:SagB/ThcOx family dehydrogenase [Actinomycetota bacterium]MBV8563584.1 SagB/ThcOx family dehydrogenase [Actinomycetota bacterium]
MNHARPVLRSVLYGRAEPELSDAAEEFHEASKLYPQLSHRVGRGVAMLSGSPELQAATRRPGRVNPQLPSVPLPAPLRPEVSLWEAIAERRSGRPSSPQALRAAALSTLLLAGYGETGSGRRAVPSGGALYPLELYVVAHSVGGLAAGLYHVDPGRRALELLHERDVAGDIAELTPMTELTEHASAVVLVTAVFWRTRFKYGLRGYRFALLEAGHAMQNMVLAAAALRVEACPLGGYFDCRAERFLGVDGVDESVVYGLVLGGETC